jgi:hypothetical protein
MLVCLLDFLFSYLFSKKQLLMFIRKASWITVSCFKSCFLCPLMYFSNTGSSNMMNSIAQHMPLLLPEIMSLPLPRLAPFQSYKGLILILNVT